MPTEMSLWNHKDYRDCLFDITGVYGGLKKKKNTSSKKICLEGACYSKYLGEKITINQFGLSLSM